MSMTEKPGRAPRRIVRTILIAAALIAALTVSAIAAFGGELLQSWFTSGYFAPQWEMRTGGQLSEGQTRLIDRLTVPVGQSVTADGITATVDSVFMGETGLWALVKMEGYPFVEGKFYELSESDAQVFPHPEAGLYGGQVTPWDFFDSDVTDGVLHVLVQYTGTFSDGSRINDGAHTLELLIHGLAENREQISDGVWEFSVPLPEQTLPTLTASPVVVTSEHTLDKFDVLRSQRKNTAHTGLRKGKNIPTAGAERTPAPRAGDTIIKTYTVTDIRVNAVGIRYQESGEDGLGHFDVFAVLKDGTQVPTGAGVACWDGDSSCAYLWEAPLELENVAAIRIGDTEIPLP